MRDQLAGRLLDQLLDWTDDERTLWMGNLSRLAEHKFDDYEGFSAGERFFERLARWLAQFEMPERRRLMGFLLTELVFISRTEMNHAIACAYPHHIKRALVDQAASEIGISPHRVSKITSSQEFRSLRRRTLFLGLSDGARLDLLRRSTDELSHEQFSLAPELGSYAQESMLQKLAIALGKEGSVDSVTFKNVVLIDDFYGSGTSLIDKRENGTWKGKLERAQGHIQNLASQSPAVVDPDPSVTVVIYVASGLARRHIESMLAEFAPSWRLVVVQELPDSIRVAEEQLSAICMEFWDSAMEDEHKGAAPLGYKDVALPVVLFHNTPNNSISVLWADTEQQPESRARRALFPRYERHHADRP